MGREGRGKAFSDYELAKKGLDQPEEHKWTRPTPKDTTDIVVFDMNGGQCDASKNRSQPESHPFYRYTSSNSRSGRCY